MAGMQSVSRWGVCWGRTVHMRVTNQRPMEGGKVPTNIRHAGGDTDLESSRLAAGGVGAGIARRVAALPC
jgi:hypothetical protein